MAIERLKFLLLLFLLPLTVTCGGGGGGGGDSVAGSAATTTGSLTLTLNGLPGGVDGAVSVSGPAGFAQSVKATQTLTNLAPGTYTVAAANVIDGANTYTPLPISQNVSVGAGNTAVGAVAYAAQPAFAVALRQVAGGLVSPLFLTAPASDARLFIVEKPGRIRIVKNGTLLSTPFLNITSSVSSSGERGLLSMAFDPHYTTNGFLYVYYTDLSGNIAVDRFKVSTDPDMTDPTTVIHILSIPHPVNANHNGGLLAFGPDGFLYVGTGDGGGAGDPPGNAQNLDNLLGKLLRIDVSAATAMQPYSIPATNPFLGQAGRRGEIWAYGLRNPWRYAFDATAGLLYIADVGQARREEVDVAVASEGGLNYGWNVSEGSLCYPNDPCDKTGMTPPVFEYDHSLGCSITGGYVYRGSVIPELQGRYFYSDFCGGWLKSLVYRAGAATEQTDWPVANIGSVLSFGEDGQKEMYMLSSNGNVYRIEKQ